MINILLICSAGMSTSLLVTKMQKIATDKGIEANIWAVGDSQAKINIPKADVVLLGPQIKFMLPKIKQEAGNIPVEAIDMVAYGTMNGEKVLETAIRLVEGK